MQKLQAAAGAGRALPHAGDYVSTETNYYEVVYMPFQTRIYLYDEQIQADHRQRPPCHDDAAVPLGAGPAEGCLSVCAQAAGATEQDFVAAAMDIRPLQDKEMSVTLEFSGLTGKLESDRNVHAALRPLRDSALRGAGGDAGSGPGRRQRGSGTCPVSGAALGSRGPIVKLYVTDIPLYLSRRRLHRGGQGVAAEVRAARAAAARIRRNEHRSRETRQRALATSRWRRVKREKPCATCAAKGL